MYWSLLLALFIIMKNGCNKTLFSTEKKIIPICATSMAVSRARCRATLCAAGQTGFASIIPYGFYILLVSSGLRASPFLVSTPHPDEIHAAALLHYYVVLSGGSALLPRWSPFGDFSPHGDQNEFFGPHLVPIYFQSPHFLNFRLKNASKVSAATI